MTLMNKNTVKNILTTFLVFIWVLTVGCTTRIADLTLVSTKNIDLNNTHLDARQGKRMKGEDCVVWPLGLIPLGIPNLEEAVDDALEKANGNIMIDEVTYNKGAYFILASISCIEVEGTVLKVTEEK